jgi:hypothetical protein
MGAVRRWVIGFGLVALSCLPILLGRSSSPALLQDTDTAVLLAKLHERGDALSWFVGDWPLGNHFYRPISTLSFEADLALWGMNPAGFGLTNALLCVFSVLALFWFLRELTDRVEIATGASLLFAVWHGGLGPQLTLSGKIVALAALACCMLPGRKLWPAIGACLVWLFVAGELGGIKELHTRMIGWLPGRTASTMTLFALLSLAAYARFERLSAPRLPKPPPTPLDVPATKGSPPVEAAQSGTWVWAGAALLALALALGCYEQAVMVPSLLLGVAIYFRVLRRKPRWLWHVAFWAVLGGYIALRAALVPSNVSDYQQQQLRFGPGVRISTGEFLLPGFEPFLSAVRTMDLGNAWRTGTGAEEDAEGSYSGAILTVLLALPWLATLMLVSNLWAYREAARRWVLPLAGFGFSFVAFLPMAFVKYFAHYYYLPMAMRSLFVVAMLGVAGQALVSAASRPVLQAPPRPSPAPGSLPPQ